MIDREDHVTNKFPYNSASASSQPSLLPNKTWIEKWIKKRKIKRKG
jgi:hypothetical protein